ncbi:hypothetical protein PsYK624_169360 [Phanerochaete sordida]|uniref:DUF6533 domain-containing protein n=1 Tax=Phanerochaete sordida TaxID=48140 RepID=A0A9P3GSU7_9APHY|nr:hypothetical protein PsYK624_169360 [Phanerochaete sordida]
MAQLGGKYDQLLWLQFTNTHVTVATMCVGVYEYLITLDDEVQLVWNKRVNAPTMLLIASRIVMVLGPLMNCLPLLSIGRWCRVRALVSLPMHLACMVITRLFSALRVYALWKGTKIRWMCIPIVLARAVVPVATTIFSAVHATYGSTMITSTISVCVEVANLSPGANRNTLLLAQQRHSSRCARAHPDVGQVTAARVAYEGSEAELISGDACASGWHDIFLGQVFNTILQSMPMVLIQRFMLNIRQLDRVTEIGEDSWSAELSSVGSIDFRVPSHFLGNIGEPLDCGHDGEGGFDGDSESRIVEDVSDDVVGGRIFE